MNNLKLLLTLLLVAVGVNVSRAATILDTPPVTVATVNNGGTKFELGTKWYELKTHAETGTDAKYLATDATHYNEATGLMGNPAAPTGLTGCWCFTGNTASGYSLYNRETGPSRVFYYASASATRAEMKDYTYTGVKAFDFANSQKGANYYCLLVHGSANNCVNVSGAPAENYRLQYWDSPNALNDNNCAWLFTEVGMEVEITYVKDGATYAVEQSVARVGGTIRDAARLMMPAGHDFTADATFATVVEGTVRYSVNIEESIDYSVSTAAQGNASHTDRFTSQLTFKFCGTTQVLNTTQTGTRQAIYKDRTSEKITVLKNAPIIASHNMVGTWMHGYVYVDEDKNGFSVNESTDIVNHVLRTGTDCDLKAFTWISPDEENGWDSNGTPATKGQAASNKTLPAFRAPSTVNSYRLRFLVDWNSLNPQGASTIASNGGLICDVTLDVIEDYHIRFVNAGGTAVAAKALASSGLSFYDTTAGFCRTSVGATVTGFVGAQDFLVRDFVSATLNGTTYDSWEDVAAVVAADDEVVVTLADPAVQAGKFYTIRHAGNTGKTMYDNGGQLKVQTYQPDHKFVFTFEDAGNGKFYIRNVSNLRYVQRTGISQTSQQVTTLSPLNAANCRYYVTNGLVAGHPEYYGIVDADQVSDPIANYATKLYLHVNSSENVVAWNTAITANHNSQWYLEEVPIVTLNFEVNGAEHNDGVAYTAVSAGSDVLPYRKVLSTVKGISFDDYAVEQYILNGETYTTRTQFFEAVHSLTADATATLVLRTKDSGELDITLQLWKTKGTGYSTVECNEEDAWVWSAHDNNTDRVGKKVWKLNVNDGDKDIKGINVPNDIDFRIVSETVNNGVGGQIISSAPYRYGMVDGGDNCICFTAGTGEGNVYEFSVAPGYYILQYNLGVLSATSASNLRLSNDNGSTVLIEDPGHDAQRYTITDTPAARTCRFTAKLEAGENGDFAANYFRVRIVNQLYLENSKERGYAICYNALKETAPGYPKPETQEYIDFDKAVSDYYADQSLDNYIDMLQAYSRYISCTDLNLPSDCDVYTLSFIKSDGTRVLVNNGEEGLELVPYNDENRGKPSARWISHTKDGVNSQNKPVKKLILVNKKDGKYLEATTSGVGVSEYYDEGTTSFNVRATYQDMSDYMASATDEKLLGALCMKNSAENSKLTIQNADETFAIKNTAYFNNEFSSAMLIENVEGGGNTFNHIQLREFNGDFYATYYGFYPVKKPDGAHLYYVNEVDDDNYMELIEVQAEVIRPNFPVIIISEGNGDLYATSKDEHLHIGEYTTTVESEINGYLTEKKNVLRGTFDDILTTDYQAAENGTVYVLSKWGSTSEEIGFFRYSGAKMPIGKAFYVLPAGQPIRGLVFKKDGEIVNRIELTETDVLGTNEKVFDLSGRRVEKAQKGFYIVNGKKIVK